LDNQTRYCKYCGRIIDDKKTCIHTGKISITETIIWLIVFMNLPLTFYLIFYPKLPIIWLGNLTLSLLLFLLFLFNILLNKPYLAMVFGCHQRIDRSPKKIQSIWPLCFRCLGIFSGTFLMLVFSYFFKTQWWMIVMALPLVIDGFLQKYTSYQSNQIKRFFTGIFFAPTLVIFFSYFHYFYLLFVLWIGQLIT
jgi:uncharacterized membrane protein